MIRIAEFKPDLTTEDQNKPGDLKDDVASLKQDVAQDMSYRSFRFDATKFHSRSSHLLSQMKSFIYMFPFVKVEARSCIYSEVDFDHIVFIYVAVLVSLIYRNTVFVQFVRTFLLRVFCIRRFLGE